jgi:hypothetical protein
MKAGHVLIAALTALAPVPLQAQTASAAAIVPWRTWVGVSAGSSGLGLTVGRRVYSRFFVVGTLRAMFGSPEPLGVGVGIDVAESQRGRITFALGGGALRCNCTDDEGGTTPSPTWPAAFVSAGGEFAISALGRASAGFDVDEWITGTGRYRHFEVVSFLVRFYL